MQSSEAQSVSLHLLLIEDSAGDVRLTQEAFREVNFSVVLHVASDGVEALDFLHRRHAHRGAARPDLILLDLNLPRMGGHEVLAHVKHDEELRTIPTIILTTSEAEADIVRCYQLQANCYLTKPVQLDAFDSLVRSINEFWLIRARLPVHAAQ